MELAELQTEREIEIYHVAWRASADAYEKRVTSLAVALEQSQQRYERLSTLSVGAMLIAATFFGSTLILLTK